MSFIPPNRPTDKKELRRFFEQRRLDAHKAQPDINARLVQSIRELPEFANAQHIMIFVPIPNRGEPNFTVLQHLFPDKKFFVPVITGATTLKPTPYIPEQMRVGRWNVPEPSNPQPVPRDSLDLIVVPALAVDSQGCRLGYGKGFYDRFLEGYYGITVCAVPHVCFTAFLPWEAHDVPVKIVVTEHQLLRIGPNSVSQHRQ